MINKKDLPTKCKFLLDQWRESLNLTNYEKTKFEDILNQLDCQMNKLQRKELQISVYGRVGVASVTISTDEDLDTTGSTYGDDDIFGWNVGIGTEREFGNNNFIKAAVNYVDYEDVELTSSSSNKITADVDRVGLQISVGKKF